MKHALITVAAVGFVGVVLAGSFLSPNDLKDCDRAPNDTVRGCEKADAIVAISGGATSARTAEAVQLYKAGWADRFIVSGAARDTAGPSNAQVMKQEAIEMGVPAAHITIEEQSRTTRENAEQTRHQVGGENIRRLIVVTSPYHQRRATIEFERANPGVKIVSHPVQDDPDWPLLWWLTPSGWYLAVSEIVKIVVVLMGGGR